MIRISLPLVAALVIVACERTPQQLRIDGSAGVLPLVSALVDGFKKEHPEITIDLKSGLGSGPRIDSVASGAIELAMASHGIKVDELTARGLVAHEIARTPVVFAVHSSVPVTQLSRAQVCDILSGKRANWRDVGGPDLPIVALMRPVGEVDADVAIAGVDCLRGITLGKTVRVIERPDSLAAELARTPGAFGVTALTFVEQSGRSITALSLDSVAPTPENLTTGNYTLFRESYLITRADPPPSAAALLKYVASGAGQTIIRANGAAPGREATANR